MGVQLALLLIADTGGFLAEIDGALAGSAGQKSAKVTAAENEEVEQGNKGQKIHREGVANNGYEEKTASIMARNFILTGMMNMNSTCISGYMAAKEKNMDRYR